MSNLYSLEDNEYIFETNPVHPSGGVYKRYINSHIYLVQTLKENGWIEIYPENEYLISFSLQSTKLIDDLAIVR